jgi:aldose sugar dehydrogenase
MRASTASRGSFVPLYIAMMLFAASCGGNSDSTPSSSPPPAPSTGGGGTAPPAGATTVSGTEKIGWDQPADSASQLSRFQYLGYVDDAPQVLKNVSCGTTSTNGAFACSASLPTMAAGSHGLELAAQEIGGLIGARSPLLLLNVVPKSTALAAQLTRTLTSFDGVSLVAETIATGLSAPSALAAAADGRFFIANRDGAVLVWQNGKILAAPALRLADAAQTSDVGLIGLALDPEFASNGQAFVAYVARSEDGTFVNRVLRLREANGVFGQAIPILEDRALAAPLRPPRIRVAADHTVYVSLPAPDQATAESYASYAGKILRINADGTTPRDNQGATPVISAGEATIGGFDRHPATGRLWIAGHDWQGRDFLRDFLAGPGGAATFESVVDPSGAAFYANTRIAGFLNDFFIGALNGRHLRRVHFNRSDPNRIEITEHLLDGQYGRIGDVVVGPDGAIYFCTSNAGTTTVEVDDDRLIRLTNGS